MGDSAVKDVCVCVSDSTVSDSATPWTVAPQAPLSMEFSRQEHWSGLPFPSPRDLPYPGIKPGSPAWRVGSLPLAPGKPVLELCISHSVMSNSCYPMDCNLPGSSVHGILHARALEWVAIPFSRGSSQPRDGTHVSCIAGGFFTRQLVSVAPNLDSRNYNIKESNAFLICYPVSQ